MMEPSISSTRSPVRIYSLENYSFGAKDGSGISKNFFKSKLENLKQSFAVSGMGKAVEAVLIVHLHDHPHVLLIQHQDAFFLPSGALEQGESDEQGIRRILGEWLSLSDDCSIVDLLAVWWRPNFETFTYPYCPPHVSRPKEQVRIFAVELPEHASFAMAKGFNLIAVPLFEIFENSSRFGPLIASLPHLLSRLDFVPVPQSEPPVVADATDDKDKS